MARLYQIQIYGKKNLTAHKTDEAIKIVNNEQLLCPIAICQPLKMGNSHPVGEEGGNENLES